MARTKGSLNKTTATAKDNILAVFNRLGGTAEMAKWAKDNLTEFYKLYARLLPVEQHVSGQLGHYEAIPVEQRDPLESAAWSATGSDQTTHH